MRLQTKRVYEPASSRDGRRILIDRLWPRGLSKERAAVDYWAKSIAPSTDLRKWYGHEPDRWPTFRKRYFAELDANPEGIEALRQELGPGSNTVVFSSKEEQLNNAAALVEYLKSRRIRPASRPARGSSSR